MSYVLHPGVRIAVGVGSVQQPKGTTKRNASEKSKRSTPRLGHREPNLPWAHHSITYLQKSFNGHTVRVNHASGFAFSKVVPDTSSRPILANVTAAMAAEARPGLGGPGAPSSSTERLRTARSTVASNAAATAGAVRDGKKPTTLA